MLKNMRYKVIEYEEARFFLFGLLDLIGMWFG